jgi:hypothetical protein
MLRSRQKPRFLPAATGLMSEKAPQATFSNELGAAVGCYSTGIPGDEQQYEQGDREANAEGQRLDRLGRILRPG